MLSPFYTESSFLASLTASHRQFVAYCDLDLLKNNPVSTWYKLSKLIFDDYFI